MRFIAAIFEQTQSDPIPSAALKHLPFTLERVHLWSVDGDLGKFISDLFDLPLRALLPDGSWEISNTRDQAVSFFEQAQETARLRSQGFASSARAGDEWDPELQLELGDLIGFALKHLVAWEGLMHALLSEGAFLSLPHALEAMTDLRCSVELATNYYYKQASQILRGFIEGQVVDIVLAQDQPSFKRWKSGTYRTPQLRGDNGLLKNLTASGVLDADLSNRIAEVYADLSSFVHGSERTLIHSGIFSGKFPQLSFQDDKLRAWAKLFGKILHLGLFLMKQKTSLWINELRGSSVICSICRENTLDKTGTFSYGSKKFLDCRCRECGNEERFFRDTGIRAYTVSRSSQ
jgi:hypothetical protein